MQRIHEHQMAVITSECDLDQTRLGQKTEHYEPGGVTVLNRIALTHPALSLDRVGDKDPRRRYESLRFFGRSAVP